MTEEFNINSVFALKDKSFSKREWSLNELEELIHEKIKAAAPILVTTSVNEAIKEIESRKHRKL